MTRYVLVLIPLLAVQFSAHAAIVKREPPMGALKEGQAVLVDDGTCPRGQIKRVVGGNHVKAGGSKLIERTRSCVPR
jgi:hypothetical protein